MSYFPVAMGDYSHYFWMNWLVAFPFARVADADATPLRFVHADEIRPCRKVVVGIEGIPRTTAFVWMMNDVRPTPDMVRDALVKPDTAPLAGDGDQKQTKGNNQ